MKAKHCPNCGAALEGEGRFCPECGFDLSSVAAKEKKLPTNEDKHGLDYLSSAFDDQLEERAKKKSACKTPPFS